MKIVEKKFRGSQLCRVLSYPIAYAIARLLLERGSMSLDEIVDEVHRTKPTVCSHLAKLKLANIVRYEKKGRATKYWIKYPEVLSEFVAACDKVINRIAQRLKEDY